MADDLLTELKLAAKACCCAGGDLLAKRAAERIEELEAHVWEMRQALSSFVEFGSTSPFDKQTQAARRILSETPEVSLASVKAQTAAEALEEQSEWARGKS